MATFDVSKARSLGYSSDEIQRFMKSRGLTEKKTIGGFLGNVGKSGEKLIGDTASAIFNPIDTAKNVLGLGSSIIANLIPGEQGNEDLARQVGKFYVDRYGGLDNAWNTFYTDPVGMAADISTVLGGAGAVAKLGKFGKVADTLSDLSRASDPFRVPGKIIGAAGEGASRLGIKAPKVRGGVSNALLKESDNILTRGMGNPRQLEKARGVSPIPMNDLFEKYNLYDRSPEAFGDAAKSANTKARSMLSAAPASVDTRRILQLFDDEIAKLSRSAKSSTKSQLAMQELMNRKQMFLDGIQTSENATPLVNDAASVYDIKSAFQGDLPPSSFGMPSGEIGKNLGVKKAYQTLLSGIEEQAPGIKNIGREQSALRKLQDIAKASESRGSARQNLNFSKLGSATAGGVIAGIPGAVVGYAGERIVNSPQFLGLASKGLRTTGNAMKSGSGAVKMAKTGFNKIPAPVRQGIQQTPNALYQSSRVNRMIPQQQPVVVPPSNRPIAQNKSGFTVEQFKKKEQPKSVFTNNSAFGSNFRLKARN